MKVVGATELKSGVLKADVSTQTAELVYVPDANFNGEDSFNFKVCDCAYYSSRVSDETTVGISVLAVNDLPTAQPSSVAAQCAAGIPDSITLQAFDLDNNASALTFTIVSLPMNATLHDGAYGLISSQMLPARLTAPLVSLFASYSDKSKPPSKFEFSFTVTDEAGAASATAATVAVTCSATNCEAGMVWDVVSRVCVGCPAGTFAASPGIRSSCEPCRVGTFAPNAGSVSCGPCANGQVAMEESSTECVDCPSGAVCKDTNSLVLKAGMWRPDGKQYLVYECPIFEACAGGTNFGEDLCATGFMGPLCAHCDSGFYLAWTGKCRECGTTGNLRVVIRVTVAVGLVAIGVLIWNFCRLRRLRSTATYKYLSEMRKVGVVKFRTVFFTFQTLSEFARISSLMDDNKEYPEPTNTVASILGLANLDWERYLPVACSYSRMDYHFTLCFRTIGPFLVLGLIWTWPLFIAARRKPRENATQRAAKLSIIWFELIYISTSTTILRCFVCQRIAGKNYLSAQYVLSCCCHVHSAPTLVTDT